MGDSGRQGSCSRCSQTRTGLFTGGSHPLVLHCLPSPLQSSASALHSGQCSPAPAPSAPGLLAPSHPNPLCSLRGGVLRASSVVSPSPGPPGNTARSMLLTPTPARSKPGQLSDYPASQGAGSPPLQGEPPPAPVAPCPEAELEMAGPLGLTALGLPPPVIHLESTCQCQASAGVTQGQQRVLLGLGAAVGLSLYLRVMLPLWPLARGGLTMSRGALQEEPEQRRWRPSLSSPEKPSLTGVPAPLRPGP